MFGDLVVRDNDVSFFVGAGKEKMMRARKNENFTHVLCAFQFQRAFDKQIKTWKTKQMEANKKRQRRIHDERATRSRSSVQNFNGRN